MFIEKSYYIIYEQKNIIPYKIRIEIDANSKRFLQKHKSNRTELDHIFKF